MNLKNLILVGGLVSVIGVSSFNQPFKNAQAGLTAPTTYDLHYRPYDNPGLAPDFWELANQARTSYLHDPSYTRTADGSYFNYTTTLDNSDHTIIPLGLSITMTFNRSNTSWAATGSGGYYPSDYSKIGRDNSTQNTSKVGILISNNTNKNYSILIDISSSLSARWFTLQYDSIPYGRNLGELGFLFAENGFGRVYIPSYSNTNIFSFTTLDAVYFDAWYLQDLGVSDSYTNGYNNGYTQGETDGYDAGLNDGYNDGYDEGIIDGQNTADSTVLLDAVETVVGIGINFILMIMTFSIFDISLLNIALVLVAVIGIIWILKALRG